MSQHLQGQRDVAAVLRGQLAMLAAAVFSQAILAWRLAPEGRGLYALATVYGQLLPVVFVLGADRAVQFGVMSHRCDMRGALRMSFCAIIVAALLGALGMVVVSLSMPAVGARFGFPVLTGCMLLMPVALGFTFLLRLQTATMKFGDYFVATLQQSLLNVALLVLLIAVMDFGVEGALASLFLSYLVPLIWGMGRLWRSSQAMYERLSLSGEMAALRGFAFRAYPASVAHSLDFTAGTLLVGLLAPTAEVGLLAAASAIMLRFLMVPQSLQEAVLPRVAGDSGGRPELIGHAARIAVLVTFVTVALFLIVSKPMVRILLSDAFTSAVPLLWLMSGGIVLHAASTVIMPYFDGTNRPGIVSMAIWTGLAVNCASLLALYPAMGTAAAALSFSLGLAVRFVVLGVSFRSVTGTRIAHLLLPTLADLQSLRAILSAMSRKARSMLSARKSR